METQLSTACPSCKAKIVLKKKPFEGFFFFCDDCDAELEVVQVNPLVLGEVVDEYEDFDDDDSEEYVYDDDDDYEYDDDGYDD
jgi:lysine biosynthesis protein LysW